MGKKKECKYKELPVLQDFYDVHDPRGCSTSEYNLYERALSEYRKCQKKRK